MKYVRQEEKYGCVIAVLAMILGKSYFEVKDMFHPDHGFGDRNGISTHDAISFMFTLGYIGMTIYECEGHTQRIREPEEWIKPISDINLVTVITNKGAHALLWINGKVYDPDKPGTHSIDDYENVQNITGFWKLNELNHVS